jgi:hypothetical protein
MNCMMGGANVWAQLIASALTFGEVNAQLF